MTIPAPGPRSPTRPQSGPRPHRVGRVADPGLVCVFVLFLLAQFSLLVASPLAAYVSITRARAPPDNRSHALFRVVYKKICYIERFKFIF